MDDSLEDSIDLMVIYHFPSHMAIFDYHTRPPVYAFFVTHKDRFAIQVPIELVDVMGF
jgi:hypothetical protein